MSSKWCESISCEQNIDETFKQTGWRFRQGNFCHCVIGAADDVAGRMRIRAARDHVLHADGTLIDRVDLLPPRYCGPLTRLPVSRLLLPRSGLERSDFVRWPDSDMALLLPYV